MTSPLAEYIGDKVSEVARLKAQVTELAAALRHIAFEPLGHAEATDKEALKTATEIARAALANLA